MSHPSRLPQPWWLHTSFLGLLLISLGACRNGTQTLSRSVSPTNTASNQASQYTPGTPVTTLLPERHPVTPSPFAELPIHTKPADSPIQPAGQVPSPAPDPLRFAFPTPGPAPVSAWRPPLYPTPWALMPYDHFYFSRPIAASDINWPLADYRYGGAVFADIVHTGVDIPAHPGTPVLAAGPGKVTWAGYGLYRGIVDPDDPYGLAVLIRHDFGYQGQRLYTMYGHLDQVDVVKGEHVDTGNQIGLSGQTGLVTGPHLHFEVRIGSDDVFTTRNPELWLVPPQGWGVLAGQIMNSGGASAYGQIVDAVSQENGQVWKARSYGQGNVRSDKYYRENVVISDLPAGRYDIYILYLGKNHSMEIEIEPGRVSYLIFQGRNGFSVEQPPLPGENFTPPPP